MTRAEIEMLVDVSIRYIAILIRISIISRGLS